MLHELKTDSGVFQAVKRGEKTFEIRKDDRGFKLHDQLTLKETKHSGAEMYSGAPLEFTGKELQVVVTYILRGPCYGLAEDWVIMSVKHESN